MNFKKQNHRIMAEFTKAYKAKKVCKCCTIAPEKISEMLELPPDFILFEQAAVMVQIRKAITSDETPLSDQEVDRAVSQIKLKMKEQVREFSIHLQTKLN